MLPVKQHEGQEAQTVSSVTQQQRRRQQLRRQRAGQSAIIIIIVLFLLLFLGAIFVSLIASNLRSAKRSATTSAAGRYAEAGINYLDQQLTNSAEGADWRPVPDCADNLPACSNAAITAQDPDYYWLQPLQYDSETGLPFRDAAGNVIGGYTRVNFGGPTAGPGNLGGRALVRVSYRPNNVEPISRYIRFDVVGRAGQVNPQDPTTYKNSEGVGQRVELIAYKSINLNEYVRQITNKDGKPGPFNLGAPSKVFDQPGNAGGTRVTSPLDLQARFIESVYSGPVRVNGAVSFFGVNRFLMNYNRGELLEVAGPISLHDIPDNLATAPTGNEPSQVYVNGQAVFPSLSPNFTTAAPAVPVANSPVVAGMVRDNPRGAENATLNDADVANRNLRSVGRVQPPLINAPTGPNGLTRYRELTRNSAPMAQRFTGPNAVDTVAFGPNYPGLIGWGENLYINNRADVQVSSETLKGRYSLRADWLSAGTAEASTSYWKGDFEYVPPAVTITLYPRYFTIERSSYDTRGSFTFRQPNAPGTGRRLPNSKIIRYSYDAAALATAPALGTALRGVDKFAGYPASRDGADGQPGTGDDTPYYEGDFVIFAEGNIRVRGVAGGLDAETGAYFKRNLTLVSNATIYIDGNLLRDNIDNTLASSNSTANLVKGRSSIALLAKDYVTVNTTQFLSPTQAVFTPESGADPNEGPFTTLLSANPSGSQPTNFNLVGTFGPVGDNVVPAYLTSPTPLSVFFRHGVGSGLKTAIRFFVNENAMNSPNLMQFLPDPNVPPIQPDTTLLVLDAGNAGSARYSNDRFDFETQYLFPNNGYPGPTAAPRPVLGTDNFMTIQVDVNSGQATGEYQLTRVGIAPLDVRIEALMYAQEGSFFIIPGPWFNPNRNDTYRNFVQTGLRAEESSVNTDLSKNTQRVNPRFPFYGEPMDIRITFFGQINENIPAEIGDQGAWMEKWGWIPRFYGSSGLTAAPPNPSQGGTVQTVHGPYGLYSDPSGGFIAPQNRGNGIYFEYDPRGIAPYDVNGRPIRRNPYRLNEPLPIAPRLPVAPGLLYYGQATRLPL